ncbi:MAG: amidohydrolase family protein [Verrucomicrobia bacterium]|nr:amidohydrolase family protein [Verrucomicrobiota bacterium]
MGESKQLYGRIKAAVDGIRIIDTHEHLYLEAERNARTIDLFSEYFSHYISSDIVSAGFPGDKIDWLRDSQVALDERWAAVAPYWPRTRRTAYARALLIASKDLFGIDDINEHTYASLSAKIAAANKPGWYRTVLKEKSRIDCSILNIGTTDCDREFFKPVVPANWFAYARSRNNIRHFERLSGVAIRGIETFVEAMEKHISDEAKKDIAGIKIGIAYGRPLRFDATPAADADRILSRILGGEFPTGWYPPDPEISWHESKPLTDYLIHKTVEIAERHDLPVQIHTGLLEGNGNYIVNSKPTDLANLFMEYPKCRFDIFHGSYPYSRELATLAKNFQNVYVDMCWMHIISPTASCAMLHEWLDMVPETKIFAFGGDYLFPEGVYGHAAIARENVARVLTKRVLWGYIDEDEAISLAVRLLRTNAAEMFKIAL